MSDNLSEEEYLSSLKVERHMYAWCLSHIGDLTPDLAKIESENFYHYEPLEEQYRWLDLHEEAWHWAMLKIKGEHYWVTFPELAKPTPEYENECAKYYKNTHRDKA